MRDAAHGSPTGSLPLVQFALTKLWDRQEDLTLTHQAYIEMGRVAGVLNAFADEQASALAGARDQDLDQALLRLVRVTGGDAHLVTRRRVMKADVPEEEWDVLSQLATGRLVVLDETADHQPYAELAHEALATAWGRFNHLISTNESFLAWLGWVTGRAQDGDPMPADRIAEARGWLDKRPKEIPISVAQFIAASETAAEQRERELIKARDQANAARTRLLTAIVLGVAAVVPLIVLFRPSATSPPASPAAPQLQVFMTPLPTSVSLVSFLLPTANGTATLVVDATGVFPQSPRIILTKIAISGFSGFMCAANQRVTSSLLPARNERVYVVQATATTGADLFVVKFCWSSDSPFRSNGAFLSAVLPAILTPQGQFGTVTRGLALPGNSLSRYDLVSTVAPPAESPLSHYKLVATVVPTEENGSSWVWKSNLNPRFNNQASYAIPIVASNLHALQHDSNDTFYSGIFFGMAGGAAVLLLAPVAFGLAKRKRYMIEASNLRLDRGLDDEGPTGKGGKPGKVP